MACVCGLKVDRPDNKIKCILCEQFMHLKCINIKSSDVEFLINSYKCKRCLTTRRSSLCASPVVLSASLPAEVVASDDSMQLVVSAVPDRPQYCDVGTNTNTESLDASSFSFSSLDVIQSQMSTLRSNNDSLSRLVTALRDENSLLVEKVNDLQLAFANFQKSLPSLLNEMVSNIKQQQVSNITAVGQQLDPTLTSYAQSALNVASHDNSYHEFVHSHSNAHTMQKTYAEVSRDVDKIAGRSDRSAVNVNGLTDGVGCAVNSPPPPIVTTVKVSNSANNLQTVHDRKKRKILAIGQDDMSSLNPVRTKKWVHLSSFVNSTTSEDIIKHIVENTNIDKKHLVCYCLLKKGTDPKDVKSVNFKLGVSKSQFEKIISSDLWPSDVVVREFRFFPRELNQDQTT